MKECEWAAQEIPGLRLNDYLMDCASRIRGQQNPKTGILTSCISKHDGEKKSSRVHVHVQLLCFYN